VCLVVEEEHLLTDIKTTDGDKLADVTIGHEDS
jgi:hypothetical protein